jgi:hypothetical protein
MRAFIIVLREIKRLLRAFNDDNSFPKPERKQSSVELRSAVLTDVENYQSFAQTCLLAVKVSLPLALGTHRRQAFLLLLSAFDAREGKYM